MTTSAPKGTSSIGASVKGISLTSTLALKEGAWPRDASPKGAQSIGASSIPAVIFICSVTKILLYSWYKPVKKK